jgi:hypothetical protein
MAFARCGRCVMKGVFRKVAPAVLASTLAAAGGCTSDTTSPTSPTTPTAGRSASITAEPLVLTPESRPDVRCSRSSSFGLRFVVILSTDGSVTFRRLRFAYNDRTGRSVLPQAIQPLIPNLGPLTFPTELLLPIPTPATLPSSSPIAVPDSTPNGSGQFSAGSIGKLPLQLEFGCDVPAAGTLVTYVDADDHRGRAKTMQVSVRVEG